MSPVQPMVKGVVLRGILKDVKETYPAGKARVLDRLPEEVRTRDFAHNLVHGMWYHYDAFTSLLEAFLAEVGHGRDQSIVDLGARAAGRDLGTLLKVFAKVSSPHRVGAHSASVWTQRFRDAGALVLSEKEERSFRLTLKGFREVHPLNCAFLTGYGQGAGRTWESDFSVSHDSCVHRGGSACTYTAKW